MANNKTVNERAADQLEAAINRFKADRPNGFITARQQPFDQAIKRILRHLRTGE